MMVIIMIQKQRADICTRMDVVIVEYGTFYQTFHLTVWFFHFITGISFNWDYVMWRIISLLEWIGLCTKFIIIYKFPPDPVRWYCQGFGSICQSSMMFFISWSKNDINVYQSYQVNAPSNMKLET